MFFAEAYEAQMAEYIITCVCMLILPVLLVTKLPPHFMQTRRGLPAANCRARRGSRSGASCNKGGAEGGAVSQTDAPGPIPAAGLQGSSARHTADCSLHAGGLPALAQPQVRSSTKLTYKHSHNCHADVYLVDMQLAPTCLWDGS